MRLFEADILPGLFVYDETRLRGMVDFPSQEGEVRKSNTDIRRQVPGHEFRVFGFRPDQR